MAYPDRHEPFMDFFTSRSHRKKMLIKFLDLIITDNLYQL